jgi:hypothetical protein
MTATGLDGLPRCAGCQRQVRCFRVAAEFHRSHKSRVVCAECIRVLDAFFVMLNELTDQYGSEDVFLAVGLQTRK